MWHRVDRRRAPGVGKAKCDDTAAAMIALFYRTLNGARVGDLFMTLIHTAELHKVESFHYLVSLLRHSAKVALDPAAWMPWDYTEALARSEAQRTEPPPD